MKASPQIITQAMQLYFTGESLRNVRNFLKLAGVDVSHVAVYKWIQKYVRLMEKYLDRITPKVSDTWRADEMYVKFKGNMKYVFAMMDDQTRFWLAHEVADTKYTHDARRLLKDSQQFAGKKPAILITDGLRAYDDAVRKEWWEHDKSKRTFHLREITLRGSRNNNKMERMNGEVRDREKVMRGLKIPDTQILNGYRLYHNYVRPHEGLNGLTPAEASGISIVGENKWLTLIQNAQYFRMQNTSKRTYP
jgi:transposase-like protein